MRPLLPAVLLLLQAVISVHIELVAVPVAVTDARGHHVSRLRQDQKDQNQKGDEDKP